MFLNDHSTDEERQRLLPFVTRLACADTPDVEEARTAYIKQRVGNYHFFGVTFEEGLDVLEGALAIGRQADPLGPDEVQTRMETARTGRFNPTKAAATASVLDKPFFSKVKG